MALERVTDTQSFVLHDAAMRWRAWGGRREGGLPFSSWRKLPVQILVAVANIQMRERESFEDRSGEVFHVNSSWTWVGRSSKTGVFRTRRLCLVS